MTRRLPKQGYDPLNDIQVLTPMHNGILGTEALNAALQEALNPDRTIHCERTPESPSQRPVIQLKNDYDNDVFNGDIGEVVLLQRATSPLNMMADRSSTAVKHSPTSNSRMRLAFTRAKAANIPLSWWPCTGPTLSCCGETYCTPALREPNAFAVLWAIDGLFDKPSPHPVAANGGVV